MSEKEALAGSSVPCLSLLEDAANEVECETCQGVGTIDMRLGGYSFSNPAAKCPDCDGAGFLIPANDRVRLGSPSNV